MIFNNWSWMVCLKTVLSGFNVSKVMKLVFVMIMCLHFGVSNAVVWYVDQTAAGQTNGEDWQNAFVQVQQAIDVAGQGDEIRIAAGTYIQGSQLSITKDLNIKGAYPSGGGMFQNHFLYKTKLDGDNSYRVLTINNATVLLNGLTIQRGYAFDGGGIRSNSPLVLVDCVITSNDSNLGGGINGTVIDLYNSKVHSNSAYDIAAETNLIEDMKGGGIYGTEVLLVNSEVKNNGAFAFGEELGFASGGGIFAGRIELINSQVVNNVVSARGFYLGEAAEGAGVYTYGAGLIAKNSIFWGNRADDVGAPVPSNHYGGLTSSYSLLELSNPAGVGNVDASAVNFDPGFENVAIGDFHLISSSVLIEAGNILDLPADQYDIDGDDDISETMPYDLDHRQRIFGDSVDIGSYEWIQDEIYFNGFE